MSRCNTIIAAALAAAALAAPTAIADPHASDPMRSAVDTKQDLRSPDTLDATRRTWPAYPSAARPVTAGNPNVSTAADRALAQERYYGSYGTPAPVTKAAPTVAADTGDGIARVPFVLAVFAALIAGLGAGSGLQLLHARRHAARLAT